MDKSIDVIKKMINGEAIDNEVADIEKFEKTIGDDPADMLYSQKQERLLSYKQKVMEIEADKDDFLYSMAGNKGETIDSLGRKTLSEIMSFAERITEEHGRHKSKFRYD